MKKHFFYLMMIVAMLGAAASCSDEEEDNSLDEWKTANDAAFNSIKNNPEYTELKSVGNEGSIYYKALTKGDGTKTIYYTSTVSCYYKGWFVADYPEYDIEEGDIFDQNLFDDGTPSSFTINGSLINGWRTALQNMVEGDKWEIWIPYQLAYGKSGSENGNIPGYSTLAFEIEVTSVKGAEE